ncbi:hypothetical protein [Burkholderia ubonensis]|uniref:hypothetical protein n=1 Tax=Burkholderia ubonensis TaxID=101571 RepID=UPI000B204B9C|nr:hypothetical protein [Burkholderia ubonensis]
MALSENLYIHYPAHFRRYFYVATKTINHNKNRQLPRAKKTQNASRKRPPDGRFPGMIGRNLQHLLINSDQKDRGPEFRRPRFASGYLIESRSD